MKFDKTADKQNILIAELQHRVRNTLATTRMIVRRSAELSEDLEEYVAHLDGRLAALARVQAIILYDPSAGVELGRLITDELTSVHAYRDERSQVEGPDLRLHLRAVEPLALALHELTTNALKFGALAAPSGRLSVTWRIEADERAPRLIFNWVESRVIQEKSERCRRGFGTMVLEEMLPHALQARVSLTFAPSSFTFSMELPLTKRVLHSG